jgi:DNA-binding Lrp family transcriptional regulator
LTSSIDALDARLIAELAAHPRLGLTEIARRLGVARGTAHARLERLVARGAIKGFGPDLDLAALGYPILAFVSLDIAQGRLPEAVAWLRDIPEVLEAHGTTGQRDLMCRVAARDPGHLQELIGRILATTAVRRSTSSIALSCQIAYRTAPLVARAAGRGRPSGDLTAG